MSCSISMHIRAIDWALAKGYAMSVRDYSEDDYDLQFSADRMNIIETAEGTDLPNVEIWAPTGKKGEPWEYVCTFSIIDEGVPSESINDYTVSDKPLSKEFDDWFSGACNDY